jgi:hypothetical protein
VNQDYRAELLMLRIPGLGTDSGAWLRSDITGAIAVQASSGLPVANPVADATKLSEELPVLGIASFCKEEQRLGRGGILGSQRVATELERALGELLRLAVEPDRT